MSTNEAAERLLIELQENPLPGARHAYTIVRDRLPAILAHERSAGAAPLDVETLASLLGAHERRIDYGYEESECSCGEWDDRWADDDALSYESHLVEVAARLTEGTDR